MSNPAHDYYLLWDVQTQPPLQLQVPRIKMTAALIVRIQHMCYAFQISCILGTAIYFVKWKFDLRLQHLYTH